MPVKELSGLHGEIRGYVTKASIKKLNRPLAWSEAGYFDTSKKRYIKKAREDYASERLCREWQI